MSENLTLRLTRTIKASRMRAYEAWTQPEALMRWFAPGPMNPQSATVDLRETGRFRLAMAGPSPRTGQEMNITFTGTYQEIVAGSLLRFSWEVEGDPGDPTLVTVEFKDVEGGTEVALTHERIPNQELLNRNKMGWGGMLEKLAAACEEREAVTAASR
ncbi:MAG TPA: SRPBCC domain-containing protein [Terracidiphilus sp.]